MIISAGMDSLCYEDEEFAAKLIQAGVTVTARRFMNSRHGFTVNRTDEWEDALSLTEDFIQRNLIITPAKADTE